jgi:alanyl aminopeptidase
LESRKTGAAQLFLICRKVCAAPFALATLFLVSGLSAAVPTTPAFRLPDTVVPRNYKIDLTIDPARSTFGGTARIEVELLASTKVIWLNARDLTIKDARLETGGSVVPVHAHTAGGEFLGIETDAPLGPAKTAVLTLSYQGRLQEKEVLGAYRRKVEGKWYVYTTFTPIEARRAFPCFDEPRFKTPWEISIRVPRDLKAFSNAAQQSESEERGGMKLVRFAPTALLASEVVAFAVGPFDVYPFRSSAPVKSSVPVSVLTPRGHVKEGQAGVEATARILPRLEAYTGIPYPWTKLDHLALPVGAYGAVENPGLITYLSSRLLVPPTDPSKTQALRKLEAHEISHQWFGNLVTQADWRDVWLSEGFATWMADKIMDEERAPERTKLDAIVARDRTMQTDVPPMRPVRIAIASRAQSKDVYNPLVYQKGAAILMMLDGWLGETNVRDGLRRYLHEHAFSTVTTGDLASALKQQTGKEVLPVLESFLDSTGVPKVHATIECEPKPRLRVTLAASPGQSGARPVPVCFRGPGLEQCAVLEGPAREVDLATCPAWLYLNSGGSGYYRTEWNAGQLRVLLDEAIPFLSLAEKLTLVEDLRALKASGPEVKAILRKLSNESEQVVASTAFAALRTMPN